MKLMKLFAVSALCAGLFGCAAANAQEAPSAVFAQKAALMLENTAAGVKDLTVRECPNAQECPNTQECLNAQECPYGNEGLQVRAGQHHETLSGLQDGNCTGTPKHLRRNCQNIQP